MADENVPKFCYPPFILMGFDGEEPLLMPCGAIWQLVERRLAPSADATRNTLLNLRWRLRWSRPMLAAFLGVSRDTLRRWETGERNASGAARRLIWLVDLLAFHPEKLKDGCDLLAWGKREELMKIAEVFPPPGGPLPDPTVGA